MPETKDLQQDIAITEAKLKKLRQLTWVEKNDDVLTDSCLVKKIWDYIEKYGTIEIFISDNTSYFLSSSDNNGEFDYLSSTGTIIQTMEIEEPNTEEEEEEEENIEIMETFSDIDTVSENELSPEEEQTEPLNDDTVLDEDPFDDVVLEEGDTVESLKKDLEDKKIEQTEKNKEVWFDFIENHFKKFILDFEEPIIFSVGEDSYEIDANDDYGFLIEYSEEAQENIITVTSTNKIILNKNEITNFQETLEDSNNIEEGEEGNMTMDDLTSENPNDPENEEDDAGFEDDIIIDNEDDSDDNKEDNINPEENDIIIDEDEDEDL